MKRLFNEDKLCIRELQAFHESLDLEKGFDLNMLRNIACLSEEIGEVVSAIRELKKADEPSELEEARAHLGEEPADCLAYILKLANYGGIDLHEAYLRKMEWNLNRTWHKRRSV